jgi:hypothetical protein
MQKCEPDAHCGLDAYEVGLVVPRTVDVEAHVVPQHDHDLAAPDRHHGYHLAPLRVGTHRESTILRRGLPSVFRFVLIDGAWQLGLFVNPFTSGIFQGG